MFGLKSMAPYYLSLVALLAIAKTEPFDGTLLFLSAGVVIVIFAFIGIANQASVNFREPNKPVLEIERRHRGVFFGCLRKGGFSIEMSKRSLAVGEGFGTSAEHPGIEPPVCRVEGLESFNSLESSLKMRVKGFDDVVCLGTPGNGLVAEELLLSSLNVQNDGL